jgi:hypothetical protein
MGLKNLAEAAALLVGRLGAYRAQHPLVLAFRMVGCRWLK